MSYFSELGLAEPILRALAAKGYSDPSPIQRQAIPSLLEGRDLLGIAQTGTGKTAAFSLPSLHRLAADPQPRRNAGCRMLVLSPTRELAAQIAENMRGYGKFLNLSVQCVFGGMPVGKQARALERGTDILVATPGRLLDLIDSRALTLRHVEIFVLDEADQMMDLGFIVPLKRIAALLPKQRQSLFFSATMPQAIAELGRQFINDPVRVEVAPQATTAERVEQYATFVNQAEKQALLTLRLREGLAPDAAEQAEHGAIDRALVFTRTKHGADRVVRHLVVAGIPAAAIHGNKSQAQRTAALGGFRQGTVRVLVATDIAARGIDVSGVSHVYNFEIPNVPEQYVHRIGRTARAGADGVAVSFVAPDEKAYVRDIERLTRVKLEPLALPEDFAKQAARLPAPSRKEAAPVAAARPRGEGRREDRRDVRAGEDRRDGRRDDGRRGEGRRFEGNRGENPRDGQREGPRGEGQRAEARRGDDRRHDRPQGERHRSDQPRSGQPGADRPRSDQPRADLPRADHARPDRARAEAPRGERNGEAGGDNGQRKRTFRPGGAKGVGSHRGAVRRAS